MLDQKMEPNQQFGTKVFGCGRVKDQPMPISVAGSLRFTE
jgi:hypothetical protein